MRKQTMTSSSDREVAMMMGRLPAIFVKQAGRENKRYSRLITTHRVGCFCGPFITLREHDWACKRGH